MAHITGIESTPPSITSSTENSSIVPDLTPLFTKGRYGPSHWIHFLRMSSQVKTSIQQQDAHAYKSYRTAKNEMRTRTLQQLDGVSVYRILPSRHIADRLVQAYLHTFQSVFAILDIPIFRAQYDDIWKKPELPRGTPVYLLLLVLFTGSACLPPEARVPRIVTQSWFYVAVTWVRDVTEDINFDEDWLRFHCLQLLARQVLGQKPDAVYPSTASVVRGALNRLRCGAGHAGEETESRLLAIVIELDIQEAMLRGRPPVINDHDFQLYFHSQVEADKPPNTTAHSSLKSEFTELSFYGLLKKTLPLRLRIARYVNDSSRERTFEETLRLSQEFLAALDVCKGQVDSFRMSSRPPTTCQTSLFDLFNYGFLLSLHYEFAIQAHNNPAYYYSLAICRSTSLSLLAAMSAPENEDFRRLCLQGSRALCDVHRKSTLYLQGEIMRESRVNSLFARDPAALLTRREMRRSVRGYLDFSRSRIAAGDMNVKFYLLLSTLMVFSDKQQFDGRARQEVISVWNSNLELCLRRLGAVRHEQKDHLASELHPPGIPKTLLDSTGVGFL
ncbi:hypothetical protein F4777DRAFT_455724 [Nemania sp. FL0916]|nr:hypothetical protein F4777DRAFT_455724 [Nemania sp. FL0916]